LLTGVLLTVAAYFILVQTPAPLALATGVIVIVNAYLALMLWCAASMSASRGKLWPYLPNRKASCLLLPLLLTTQVLAFAAFYVGRVESNKTLITDPSTAAYRSFINLTTFSYEEVSSSANGDRLAFWQIVSGLLLVTCALPLVVSRLSVFGGAGLRKLEFNGCQIFLPDSEEAIVSVTKSEFKWDLPRVAAVTASLGPTGIVEITAQQQWSAPKQVVISSKGLCDCVT
jgi:hypothetical protein